jgi:hypothetical protein
MPKLKPWYQVIVPREDLREGKPLDAAEFDVHLDQVRDGSARKDYQDPEGVFSRTFLNRNLLDLAAGAIRRLAGDRATLVRHLTDHVVRPMGIEERSHLGGETLVVVGSRNEAATFPYGFFKEWFLDTNTARFGRA